MERISQSGQRSSEEVKDVLAKNKSDVLSSSHIPITVGYLEQALLSEFPAEDAESWDHTGLIVGDPSTSITTIAVALDPSLSAINEASTLGANTLVTHHPPFISPPSKFCPESFLPACPGALIWAAIQKGVSLMSFHTALDVSVAAASVLPGLLNLCFRNILIPLPTSKQKGFGQVCSTNSFDEGMTLGQLASRCMSVFGKQPRVYGASESVLERIVTTTGSAGPVGRAALDICADCIVCGEMKYHDALAFSQAGLSVIELGHDISELPLTAPLAGAVKRAVGDVCTIVVLDQSDNWFVPDATRLS